MSDELSTIAHARLASGLTLDDAARITGMSRVEYEHVEARPLQMSVGELRALCRELNVDGQDVMRNWMEAFFML